MRPYSKDLRLRVVQAYENHEGSMRQLAARFRLSLSCVRDLLTRYRATGDVAPKPPGGGYPAKLDARGFTALKSLVQATPEALVCPEDAAPLRAPTRLYARAPRGQRAHAT